MKLKHILLIFGLLLFVACKKNSEAQEGGNDKTFQRTERVIEQAVFNLINFKEAVNTNPILDTLIEYIKHSPESENVYINCARLDYVPILNAIKKAFKEGVNFHIIVDYNAPLNKTRNQAAIDQLGALFLNSASEIIPYVSDVTDIGSSYAKNHQKYAIFSKVEFEKSFTKYIVLVTSRNFMNTGDKAQDAVIMSSEGLYNAFLSNWEAMSTPSLSGKNFVYAEDKVGDSLKAIFFPRIFGNDQWDGKDPIVETLDGLSDFTADTIAVAMAGWTTGRKDIIRKLKDLVVNGATVEVITMEGNSVKKELEQLETSGAFLRLLPRSKAIHTKMMLIKGIWRGERTTIILCGSHNYTGSALKLNNEDLIMFKNSILFDDYWQYFQILKK